MKDFGLNLRAQRGPAPALPPVVADDEPTVLDEVMAQGEEEEFNDVPEGEEVLFEGEIEDHDFDVPEVEQVKLSVSEEDALREQVWESVNAVISRAVKMAVEPLSNRVRDLTQENGNLETQNAALSGQVSGLSSQVLTLTATNEDLRQEVEALKVDRRALMERIEASRKALG